MRAGPELETILLPSVQEAAILYAADHVEAAIHLLKEDIRTPAGKGHKAAYLALFDLYQATGNQSQYEALGMLFTVKFETTPPGWREHAASADRRQSSDAPRKDIFALKADAKTYASDIAKIEAFALGAKSIRLDVSKVTSMPEECATALAGIFMRLRKAKLPIWITGGDSFEATMRTAIGQTSAPAGKGFWDVLFEVLIVTGKAAVFEDLSLEFAVAYEMSPPNWEPYSNPLAAAAANATPKQSEKSRLDVSATIPPATATFAFNGTVRADDGQLQALELFAASQTTVTVDMAAVSRLDYGFLAPFGARIGAIAAAQKRVVMINVNEILASLLEAAGLNRHAIVVRKSFG